MSEQPSFYMPSSVSEEHPSEAKYRLIFELAADAIFIGSKSGHFIDVNESAILMTGYSKAELLGKPMSSFFTDDELKKTPLRYDLLQKGETIRSDRLLVHKNGTKIPIEMNSRMMPDGTLQAVIRDISERIKLEQNLEDHLRRQKAIIDAAFEAIFIFVEGVCVGQNKRAEELFGYTAEETTGKHATEWILPSERLRTRQKIDSGYEGLYESVGQHKDGSTFPIEIQARMTTLDGKIARISAVRDITARKKAETDLLTIQKLESLGTLAGGLAHDLNNILTGLFGNLSLAKLHLKPAETAHRFITKAEESLTRFTRITNKLLTFSKGGQPIIQSVELTELVQEIVLFDLAGSNVIAHLDSDEQLWNAKVDAGQIQQVFSNLVINANQAMPKGGNLFVRLSNCDNSAGHISHLSSGLYIEIEINDEGYGIQPEHLKNIFDPYFTTKENGNGLGLTSVHSIISKHGGIISVVSTVGQGTKFTFYLPAEPKTAVKDTPLQTEKPQKLTKQFKILLVDDDETVCNICSSLLKSLDCAVITADSTPKAIDEFTAADRNQEPFDIAILDLTIPGEAGGVETVKELLKINSSTKMVVSSGYSDNPVMANFQKYGFSAILTKPYSLEQLVAVLRKLSNE